jgi:diphthamide biosynthesis enzyme Dph1/Dph2-like protein
MKKLFIPAYSLLDVNLAESSRISSNLPRNIFIVYSIQCQKQAEQIRKILFKNHKIFGFSQVLGCTIPNIPKQVQAVLIISDGKFHAVSLAYESKLPVLLYNNGLLEKISEKEIEALETQKKASYNKYLNSNSIGIIVSSKPGQENLQKSVDLKKRLSKSKKCYLFICNTINSMEFENFNIDSWINTACPRLDMSLLGSNNLYINRMINLSDIN